MSTCTCSAPPPSSSSVLSSRTVPCRQENTDQTYNGSTLQPPTAAPRLSADGRRFTSDHRRNESALLSFFFVTSYCWDLKESVNRWVRLQPLLEVNFSRLTFSAAFVRFPSGTEDAVDARLSSWLTLVFRGFFCYTNLVNDLEIQSTISKDLHRRYTLYSIPSSFSPGDVWRSVKLPWKTFSC